MTADPKRVCATCALWVRANAYGGTCRRYPPRVFASEVRLGYETIFEQTSPSTAPDHFCGEHRHDR